jgi:hypothetical protein
VSIGSTPTDLRLYRWWGQRESLRVAKENVMRLKLDDLWATLLVLAVAVPYVGYLLRGEMPLIEDARGMAGTGVVLAAVAYLVMWRGDVFDTARWLETALAVGSLSLGVVAYQLSQNAAEEALLAVFMLSIALVWTVKIADHLGLLPRAA